MKRLILLGLTVVLIAPGFASAQDKRAPGGQRPGGPGGGGQPGGRPGGQPGHGGGQPGRPGLPGGQRPGGGGGTRPVPAPVTKPSFPGGGDRPGGGSHRPGGNDNRPGGATTIAPAAATAIVRGSPAATTTDQLTPGPTTTGPAIPAVIMSARRRTGRQQAIGTAITGAARPSSGRLTARRTAIIIAAGRRGLSSRRCSSRPPIITPIITRSVSSRHLTATIGSATAPTCCWCRTGRGGSSRFATACSASGSRQASRAPRRCSCCAPYPPSRPESFSRESAMPSA